MFTISTGDECTEDEDGCAQGPCGEITPGEPRGCSDLTPAQHVLLLFITNKSVLVVTWNIF